MTQLNDHVRAKNETQPLAGADPPPPDTAESISRRSLLQRFGVGAATVVVAGIGVGSYRVFDNGVLDSGSGSPYDAWSQWRDDSTTMGTVGAAILAANPHNSQPWIFHVTANSVELFTDASRRTGTLDPLDREHQIGLGCALENLVLAAAARGYQTTVTLMPQPNDPTHVATVEFTTGTAHVSKLYDAIGDRHSNRGPYTNAAVAGPDRDTLTAQTDGLTGVATQWFTTPAERAALGALIIDATTAIIADTQQSTDAFAWFRNNRDDIDTHMDGLTLDGQGLSPIVLTIAKLLPASSRSAGDTFWLTQTRTVHTATAAAYGVITVADSTNPAQRLNGGRLLQRIHLAATTLGLGLQHMNQITERVDREATLDQPARFANAMDALLAQTGQHALSTFRIGHPVRVGLRSPRRPVTAVTQ